jgi:Flp pilus assembly protein TadG
MSTGRGARRRAASAVRDDRGSLAIEYVIAAPLLLIVFGLIFAYARIVQLEGELDSATRDAARAVTQLPDLSQSQSVAQRLVAEQLGGGEGGCNSGSVRVTVSAQRPDGQPDAIPGPGDTVTVAASCPYSLAGLGLPVPMPGRTAHSQFSSVVDPNRSTG